MGITNEIAATGYATPFQGESRTSGTITPGPFVDDITLTAGLNLPVVIAGATLVDGPAETNYVGNILLPAFNQPGTGLIATPNAATKDLGDLALTDFDEAEGDTYNLNITAGGATLAITLDGSANNYDYSLEGISFALANTIPTPTDLTATGGTLSNGVQYDISSGSLVLTGPDDGSEIELAESIVDNGVLAATGGITDGSQVIYGTFNIAPSSVDDVVMTGAPGLANVGLEEDTLDGASSDVDLFTVLTRLEEAVRAGNFDDINGPGGSIQAQIENLDKAANQNRVHRSRQGAKAQRVDSGMELQAIARVDLQQILSRYQDADAIEIYNDIMQKESAFKAALSITGRISQVSILDYF